VRAAGLEKVNLALVYFDIGSQQETAAARNPHARRTESHLRGPLRPLHRLGRAGDAPPRARNAACNACAFRTRISARASASSPKPCSAPTAGKRCLLAQAPTGIGKTVGTMFPALKAAPKENIDKLLLPGREDAGPQAGAGRRRDAEGRRRRCCPARTGTDRARQGLRASRQSLPRRRLPAGARLLRPPAAARAAALDAPLLDRDTLRTIGLAHDVCPYYLGSEMARWSDMIVGDYNYWFDGGAMLYALALERGWRVSVLADEAHNLVSRARGMYSADWNGPACAPPAPCAAGRAEAAGKVGRAWTEAGKSAAALPGAGCLPQKLLDSLQRRHQRHQRAPGRLPEALDPACRSSTSTPCTSAPGGILRRPFAVRPHAHEDERDTVLASATWCRRPSSSRASSSRIRPRCSRPRSAPGIISPTCSACPEDTAWIDVDSPFVASQLAVQVARGISTRYQHRKASLAPIADLMAQQYAAARQLPGLLQQLRLPRAGGDTFARRHPEIPAWRQSRRMSEAERARFWSALPPKAKASASRCWAAPSAKASTCRARA
jgi:DNA excision repair protein ERCC-2